MDINRVTNEKKLNLCRWYFRGKFNNIILFIIYSIREKFLKTLDILKSSLYNFMCHFQLDSHFYHLCG